MQKKPINEALKEFGRIIILATLPVATSSLESGSLFTWATGITILVAALRALDSYIHESKDIKANGLIPF